MSTATLSERQPNAALALGQPTVGATGLETSGRTASPAITKPAGTAHQVVEAAMSAADRLASGEQKSVNLQFSVGNADLSVRVELRDGALHATFRTDSTELRSALAHEWQSVSSSSTERSVRLADPVFTSANSSSLASSGENASQQRTGQDRPSSSRPSNEFGPSGGSDLSAEVDPVTTTSLPLSTSLHLHAFA